MSFYLKNYVTDVVDCLHATAPYTENGIPIIRTTDIKNGRLLLDNCLRISSETYDIWTQRSVPKEEDIIMAREAPVGAVGMVPKNQMVCLGQRTVQIIPNRSRIYPKFLLYALTHNKTKKMLNKLSAGSTVKHLNVKDIRNLKVPLNLPDIKTQIKVGDELYLYDQKIEINKNLISELEEYSQILFHKWFIDFNFPVENGKPYKDSDGEMIEVDGNLIPKGWNFDSISLLGNIVGGGTPSTIKEDYYATTTEIPWITPKDLSDNKAMYMSRGERDITEAGLRNSSAVLMPKGTVLMSSRAPVGYLTIALNPFSTNQGFKSVVPIKDGFSEFIYYSLKNKKRRIDMMSSGSTFSEISKDTLKKLKVIIPPDELIISYSSILEPLFKKIQLAEKEIEMLTELRDLMVNKLIR